MNRSHHVGGLRIRRFIRWLVTGGYSVILLRAGQCDGVRQHSWGREIVVGDPLGLHPDHSLAESSLHRKEYSLLVELASQMVFNPDPAIAWGRKLLRLPEVLAAAAAADLIISSSPPESSHVTAVKLARRGRAKLFVDMRDGWLDEPLKRTLARSALQRWREGALEKRVLQAAHRVFVSSPLWREMLLKRYPDIEPRLTVLTNCYPVDTPGSDNPAPPDRNELRLLHAGQFRGSKYNNRPGLLLGPLIKVAQRERQQLRLSCHGKFTRQDIADIESLLPPLRVGGGTLELSPPLSYEAMLEAISQAHGLLMLSATMASLPAKIFEYIPSRRPILAATREGSAVWQLAERLPQMHVFSVEGEPADWQSISDFFIDCRKSTDHPVVPEEFSDSAGMRAFLQCLPPA